MSVNQGVMRIGEVHAQLRKDFPDVELSKIRYYEDKGLVEPSRSRKGYRLYSERDVACLREAIRLAQEDFVPLRVVRLRLIEQGLLSDHSAAATRSAARETAAKVVSAPVPSTRPALSVVSPPTGDGPAAVTGVFSSGDLLSAAALTPEEFNQIQSMGLVTPVVIDGETTYDALDVRVAAHAGALLARGAQARALGSLRRIAEREVGVVDEITSSLRGAGGSLGPDEASVVADVAREVQSLRCALAERELVRYLGD